MAETDPTNDLSGASAETVRSSLEQFVKSGSAANVYARPVKDGSTTLIPAAEVAIALGFGLGGGGSPRGDGGSGGGGGGYTFSRPVAVVISSSEGVRVEPVVDVTKVALAFITALGFMLASLTKMKKGKTRA